jgi:hypothetical protein
MQGYYINKVKRYLRESYVLYIYIMTIVDTFSVISGLAVILTLLGSIAVEGIRRRGTNKKKIIPTIDSKWNKTEIAA